MPIEQYTDQQIKQAQAQVSAAKESGFIHHLHTLGKSAAEIKTMHARYVKDDAKRLEYLEGLRDAIMGNA